MARRAGYMYGAALDRGPKGPGWRRPPAHQTTLLGPALDIGTTAETHTIDGVEFKFEMAPNTEAPSEMHFYIRRYNAL